MVVKVSGKQEERKDVKQETGWRKVGQGAAKFNLAWLLVFPLILLLPSINSFPYPSPSAKFSDLVITHYPNAIYLKQAVLNWGQIPLWSGTIMSGYPFAANPLSGLWYPPGWLALIFPLPFGFNLLVGLHLIWGGLGLSLLLREEGLGKTAAIFSGVSFALLPKLFAHYGAGHLTLLYAIPWTPWLLYSQRIHGDQQGWRRFLPGLTLCMVLLADVRWSALAALTWLAYAAVHRRESWMQLTKDLVSQGGMALLLAAPLLVPLVEFTRLSTRSSLTGQEVLAYSLPPSNLLGLLFPNPGTNHEWVLYSGAVVLLLAVGGLLLGVNRRGRYFWAVVSLLSILVALGSYLPFANLVSGLPLVSWLRVPARSLFLTGLGLAALAGYGLEALLNPATHEKVKVYRMLLFGAGLFSLLLVVGTSSVNGEITKNLVWGAIAMLASIGWIWLATRQVLTAKSWLIGLFLILVFDLSLVDMNSFAGRDSRQVLGERDEVASYIAGQGGDTRTYSPSYSIPQQTAISYGISMADGVDPLQIAGYAEFMDEASGVPRGEYSVTIPPFENGNPGSDNQLYTPDAEKLGLLNVGYVAADFELDAAGLIPEEELGEVRIYKNLAQRPPAWVQSPAEAGGGETYPAQILLRTANWIKISASGPGTLVLSEIMYPGWKATVDGREENLSLQYGNLRGIELSAGEHEVEFKFVPLSVYSGLALLGLGLLLMGISTWRSKSRHRGE